MLSFWLVHTFLGWIQIWRLFCSVIWVEVKASFCSVQLALSFRRGVSDDPWSHLVWIAITRHKTHQLCHTLWLLGAFWPLVTCQCPVCPNLVSLAIISPGCQPSQLTHYFWRTAIPLLLAIAPLRICFSLLWLDFWSVTTKHLLVPWIGVAYAFELNTANVNWITHSLNQNSLNIWELLVQKNHQDIDFF